MEFHSFRFFIFFPLVVALYYALSFRFRKIFLLTASYYFYICFRPEYVLILIASTAVDYVLGKKIHQSKVPGKSAAGKQINDISKKGISKKGISKKGKWEKGKLLFIAGLINNLGLLFLFKYFNFFNETLKSALQHINVLYDFKAVEWMLPVGISYYTFKKVSYLIDVYRETIPAEKEPLTFALYVSFFPEIMAGPIDRAGKLMPQFNKAIIFDYKQVTDGLKLMAWGFFKKMVIADRLALFVNKVYDNPGHYEGLSLVMATVYFSIQIYCDFSGYSDIAIGAGKVMGYELVENFDRPYFARNIGEFWKRWHMSLTSWLMDYLFLPIAYGVSRRIKNPRLKKIKAEVWAYITGIIFTMVLCGIWHGAGWTFLAWGTIHGLYMALAFATKKIRKRINKKLGIKKNAFIPGRIRVCMTFGFVTFAWIFFRANTISDAYYIVTHLFSGWSAVLNPAGLKRALHFGLRQKELAVVAISLFAVFLVHIFRKDDTFQQWVSRLHIVARWSIYVIMVVWLLVFAEANSEQFIYFRF